VKNLKKKKKKGGKKSFAQLL